MSDLISRQAAIDALAKFVPYAICDESTESYTNGLTDAYNLICQLPSAQPDEEKISDLLYDVYRLTCPQLGTGGVALLKSYIFMVYREIFGEEGPEWMR